jgi:RNA polymerase sigma-70 factor (ECF subfamily)
MVALAGRRKRMVRKPLERSDWRGLSELRGDVERSLARSCRDSNELDDLVQETLLRAARYRKGLLETTCLRSWVIRIAWNVLRDHIRRERRMAKVELTDDLLSQLETMEEAGCSHPGTGDVAILGLPYDYEDVVGVLQVLLEGLPLEDRHLIESYYDPDRGCASTAACLSVTTQTIKMRLYRLRRKLRNGMQKQAALALSPCHPGLEVMA